MSKKLVTLLFVAMLVAVAQAAPAVIWIDAAGDNNWHNNANWQQKISPYTTPYDPTGGNALIQPADEATAYTVNFSTGADDSIDAGKVEFGGTLNLSSGTLTSAKEYQVGRCEYTMGQTGMPTSYINISGTGKLEVTTADKDLVVGAGSVGILNMSGGEVEVLTTGTKADRYGVAVACGYNSTAYGQGYINLSGGTIRAWNIGIGEPVSGKGGGKYGRVDITGTGQLVLTGDWTNPLDGGNGQRLAGYISAHSVRCSDSNYTIGLSFDGTNTTVQAVVPEPATVALLGLGGLALLRRRK
jgi:hypothetical protein